MLIDILYTHVVVKIWELGLSISTRLFLRIASKRCI